MKVLFIEKTADGLLDIVIRAQRNQHDCRYFCQGYDERKCPVGKGLVTRIPDWRASIAWADLVVLGSNDLPMREIAMRCRARGVPWIGGTEESAAWENDRLEGMRVFRKAGIPVPEIREFTDYESAIAHVESQGHPLYSKPCWIGADKALSCKTGVEADPSFMLRQFKRQHGRPKGTFILQEPVSGVEMGVGCWFGPGGFTGEWEENFEEKRLCAGDLGPNTGEMGCYSADTEVLTRDGWKLWPEVVPEDHLATLIDGRLDYEKPSALVEYDVNCAMIGWKNQSIDVLVTPNHNMFVATQWSARCPGPDDYKLLKAEDCTQSQYAVKRTAEWMGEAPEPMVFPAFYGRVEITIAPIEWARFLGLYIAEGCASGGQVSIAASHPEKSQKVGQIIHDTGLKFSTRGEGFTISCARLARHLRPFGRAWEKFVPPEIKDSTPAVIDAFLEGYALGDGNMQTNGFRVFYTSSKRLADDVQELLLKIGRLGLVKSRNRIGIRGFINGRPIHSRRIAYEVIERPRKLRSWLDKRDRYEVRYVGKVYCAEVSHHTLFVRRNGKPMWCGNTVMRYVSSSKLADKVLKPVEDMLHRTGFIGCIDCNVIIDEDGTPWPLEWTMRCGWPSTNIEQALVIGDFVEFLAGLAEGKPPKGHRLNEVAVGVVMALPPFPGPIADYDQVVGYPVYGITPAIADRVHFAEMQGGKEAPLSAGDYLLVATGAGGSITAARAQAMRVLNRLSVPASPFWRPDIGGRLRYALDGLQGNGFARGLEYS